MYDDLEHLEIHYVQCKNYLKRPKTHLVCDDDQCIKRPPMRYGPGYIHEKLAFKSD